MGSLPTTAAYFVSLLAFPLVWLGMILAACRVSKALYQRRTLETPEHMALIAFGVVILQVVIYGLSGTYGHPHYYNATWAVFVLFAWFSVDFLSNFRLGALVTLVYAASLAIMLTSIIARIHQTGGSRTGYGPTLANQMKIASQLKLYSPGTPISIEVANYQRFPHALATLRLLDPPDPSRPLQKKMLRIVYSSPNPDDGRIRIIEK